MTDRIAVENVSPIIAPDKTLMLQHLDLLFGRALTGRVEVTAIHTDKAAHHGPRTRFFDCADLDDAADFAVKVNAEPGWNVYVGAALRVEDVFPGKAADDGDFLKTYALWADADDGASLELARQAYRQLDISPPFIVVTGRTPSKRAQLWWPLDNPIDDINVLRASLRGIASTLHTDSKVCTGKQLMRLGGGVNWPKKEDRILERTEVVVVARAAREFSVDQMHRAFAPMERAEFNGAVPQVEIAQGGSLGLQELVMDGRETYAFHLCRAHLHELLATTGAEPSPDELYTEVAPIYLAKTDQTRPGRGPSFLKQKCNETLRAFQAGQIPFARNLDHAVETYAQRHREIVVAPVEGVANTDAPDGEPADDVFEVLTMGQIKALPPAQWMVEGAIGREALGFIYGPPGSYKSFVCYDLALSWAYRRPTWIKRDTKGGGSVLYIASEGATGSANRIAAWQQKYGVDEDTDAFRLIRRSMSFMDPDDVERLDRTVAAVVAQGGPVDLIFVDTVSRVLPGADENLQKDMTIFVAACDRLRERYGATVIGVHHTNKNGDMRGSTVFLGQGDFVMRVEKDEHTKGGVLTCEKQKEAEDGWREAFSVETRTWVPAGSFKEVSSLTVEFAGETVPDDDSGFRWPSMEDCKAMLAAIDLAWRGGKPWSPHARAQSEGRYAVRNLSVDFDTPAESLKWMLSEWQRTGVLGIEIADAHTKQKGLKVLRWL